MLALWLASPAAAAASPGESVSLHPRDGARDGARDGPRDGLVPPPPAPAAEPTSTAPRAPPHSPKAAPKNRSKAQKNKKRRRRSKQRRAPRGAEECDFKSPLWEHKVVEGEHLGLIAGRYGVRRGDLAALNPELRNPDLIHPGDSLKVCPVIPPRARHKIQYIVQPGDSLARVAQQYGLSVRDVVVFQEGRLANPNRIVVGQSLDLWLEGPVLPPFDRLGNEEAENGSLAHGIQLPPGAHYHIKRPRLAYGTPKTVHMIRRALGRYGSRRPGGPKVYVGDISKQGGGFLNPHVSHRSGRDVDVGYIRVGPHAHNPRFTGVDRASLDVPRSWELVKSFLDTHEVRYIFMDIHVQRHLYEYARSQGMTERELDELFQYPRGRGRQHGIIRHWRSHRNHFHVRFR